MTLFYNKHSEKAKRRELRKNSTTAERILWKHLKAKRFSNLKFRRQYSIGKFVIDFYCPKHKLAIELDGSVHEMDEIKVYDDERENIINTFGISFLRFINEEVYINLENVLNLIKIKIENLEREH